MECAGKEWLQKLFSHYRYVVSLNKLIGFDIRGQKRSDITKSQEIDFLWLALFIFASVDPESWELGSRDRSGFINGDFKHHGSVKIRHQAEKSSRKS